MQTPFENMFSPSEFQTFGHKLIDMLTEYLTDNLNGQKNVIDWVAPQKAQKNWQQSLPEKSTIHADDVLKILKQDILHHALHIHHPHNIGHQVAPPLPLAALCDLVASLTNQAMAVYETGPSATMLERQVISWLTQLIGWENGAGILTSGGAQANLTALLAARQLACENNIWQQGVDKNNRLCIITSEHAHYSVQRSAGIMGIGTQSVIAIPADANGRMQIDALKSTLRDCREEGKTPIAVIATAGCTPTGSIDPLEDIAHVCQQYQVWLHVDAAHGGSTLLSTQHQHKLKGIAMADSVVWDGHKLLYMPGTVSAVLFKEVAHSFAAFAQEASYLFQQDSESDETYNTSYRTLECTKRMMGLKLWLAFSLYGKENLGALVDHVFGTAQTLAEKVAAHPRFDLLMHPQTNIVCFRHLSRRTQDLEASNLHQTQLRKQLITEGSFHITQVNLHGTVWLRTTIMNPYTTDKTLNTLLNTLDAADMHEIMPNQR